MTDEWDKLWERKATPPLIMRVMENTENATPQWIHKVKAEGDRLKEQIGTIEQFSEAQTRKIEELQEKAEKWDHMINSDPTIGSYLHRRMMEKKLEAIKPSILAIRTQLHTLCNIHPYGDMEPDERVHPKKELVSNLLDHANEAMKILEGEG